MPKQDATPLTERNVRQGTKYLRTFQDLLAPLVDLPAHGNRQFHYHHWASLLLLHFYNPALNSLRALAGATDFAAIQKVVGLKHTSLGSMSESAAKMFDPALLEPIIRQAGAQAQRVARTDRRDDLPGVPTAVDGSFLRCLPKMTWASFRRQSDHRGVRLHLHLDVVCGIPTAAEITRALGSEKQSLRKKLEPGKLYLTDRGYIDYGLYQAIHEARAYFVARLKENSTYEEVEARPLTEADRTAGVTRDAWVRMGSAFTEGKLTAPVRRVVVAGAPGKSDVILLTNAELSAELVGQMYRYRWQVELFFRWFKCVLACRHWLSLSEQGLTLQVYMALLASILLALWTGLRLNRSIFRVVCLHLQGWVSDEELLDFIARAQKKQRA